MELHTVRRNKAGIIIGKNQLSQGTINQIEEHIKRNGIVKIKILKTALSSEYSKNDLIAELSSRAKFHVIESRGYTVILTSSEKNK